MILHSSKRPCCHLRLMTFRLDSRPYCTDKTWPWERAACEAATSKGPLEAWLGWLVHTRKWKKAHSKGGLTIYSVRNVEEFLFMDMVNRMHDSCDSWMPMRHGLNLQEPTISSKESWISCCNLSGTVSSTPPQTLGETWPARRFCREDLPKRGLQSSNRLGGMNALRGRERLRQLR